MQFPRERRLTESGEYRRVRSIGRSKAGTYLVMGVATDQGKLPARFGIITTKRVGNAVARNCIRRRIRAVIQEVGERLPHGTWIVTVARHGAKDAPYQKLRSEWLWLSRKLLDLPRPAGETPGSPR